MEEQREVTEERDGALVKEQRRRNEESGRADDFQNVKRMRTNVSKDEDAKRDADEMARLENEAREKLAIMFPPKVRDETMCL